MHAPLQVIDLLRHAARNHSGVEVVSRLGAEKTNRSTYGEVYQRVCQLSRALERLGVRPGDRVATLAWNTHRHLELYYATAAIGAVCHTVNPRLHPDQLVWIVGNARDVVLFFDSSFEVLVRELQPRMPSLRHVLPLAPVAASEPSYEALLAAESDAERVWPQVDEHSACGLCYTSGTTGDPKGVAYTHRSSILHAYAIALPDSLGISARDVVMPLVPMFHVNAWGLPYALPMVGAKMVLPGGALDGASLAALIDEEQVTLSAGVPTLWRGLLEHLRTTGRKLPSLARINIGGAAAPESMIAEFEDEHGIRVVHGWGMTELSPLGAINQPVPKHDRWTADERRAHMLKQGREPFGIEMQLESPDGTPVPRDGASSGNLLVRGLWVVDTYDGGVPAQRSDGWFDTGDVATIDGDGYMQIVDRSKDVIKSGGEWISSVDLESAAMTHPAVMEAAAIGVPDLKWSERPLLVCVLREGAGASAEDIRGHLAGKVAKWWIPERIEFAPSLPHGATGKVLKMELRKVWASASRT